MRLLVPLLSVLALAASPASALPPLPTPADPIAEKRDDATVPAEPDTADPLSADDDATVPSKKQKFLDEKSQRKPIRARHAAVAIAHVPLTFRNIWTHELLPVDPVRPPPEATIDDFLRDHFTNQATSMDPRLGGVILKAAGKFKSSLIEVVSGFRSQKYNLMLRKKGHAVARESQHPLGHAVDFRLAGVATRQLYKYVRSLHLGGTGYYPHNGFVHADVGRVRTWKGD